MHFPLGRRIPPALALTGLVAGSTIALTLLPGPRAEAERQPVGHHAGGRTVTLVTGDRVTMEGDRPLVERGPDRDGVTFTVSTGDGRVRVVPSDAAPALTAGRLDPRLFDVTGLLDMGYDRTGYLPLIVTGDTPALRSATGLRQQRSLAAIGATAVRQERAGAARSWQALTANIKGKIWLDGMRRPALDASVPQVGAPAAWAAGYTGTGSTVAVLDSGVDDTHPDLAGQVTARMNFTDGPEPDRDLTGHGTHVASTIAGTGAASDGRYRGVAPGAKLLDGKVCGVEGCAESAILAGMNWAAAEQRARVVNLSLGGEDDPAVVDPVEEAVQTLSDRYGTLFVVSAGNSGIGAVDVSGQISSPGSAPAALTVGAVGGDGRIAGFSLRGPTADGSLKPDMTAPGVDITAARSAESPGSGPYTAKSGTSMAAPHVAGGAAILAQRHPDWTGQQLKAALVGSATPNAAFDVYAQGAGRLDLAGEVTATVTAAPATIGFGIQRWPHADDAVLTRTVTYRNSGRAAVTLALRLDSASPVFALSTATLTVPAGGTADVTVTADTRTDAPDGLLGGWLMASAGEVTVRTPVAVHKEVESYDLTIRPTDRKGGTPPAFGLTMMTHAGAAVITTGFTTVNGTRTFRLPRDSYTLVGTVAESTTNPKEVPVRTLLAQPDLVLNRALTVDLDARVGQPITVTVPRSDARQVAAHLGAGTDAGGVTFLGDDFSTVFAGRIGGDTRFEKFRVFVGADFARADATGSTFASPYHYALAYPQRGSMFAGFQRTVVDSELARVTADFAASGRDGSTGLKRTRMIAAEMGASASVFMPVPLPFTRTEYYNTEPGVTVAGDFREQDADGNEVQSNLTEGGVSYRAGRSYRELWNRGVFAPAVATTPGSAFAGVGRDGDTMVIRPAPLADGAGRPGGDATATTTTRLFRNGMEIPLGPPGAPTPVPSADAAYRLEFRSTRTGPLSPTVDAVWTFRSGPVEAGTHTNLPLWTVRFAPRLDGRNTAPAGRPFTVPVLFTPQPGSGTGTLRSPRVEVSYDDGRTWVPARMNGLTAHLTHPRNGGFVSLRATASDSRGNTVTTTVIRAYRYA
ncbi:S8 family serine peptidase [Virgisporangium ochraceum]